MKNIELYRTIEALVQNKKLPTKPGQPSLTQQYCKHQLQKKRLIPVTHHSKINRLMKNFQNIETYVDIEQLFEHINKLISQKSRIQFKSNKNIGLKSNINIAFNDEYQIILKARQLIAPHIYKIYMKQNQQLKTLIKQLQNQSNLNTYRLQNSSSTNDQTYHLQSLKQQDNQSNNLSKQKQSWKYYQKNNYTLLNSNHQKNISSNLIKPLIYQPNIKKRQEKAQLIHQVITYLQIILENLHRKKWNKTPHQPPIKQHQKTIFPSLPTKSLFHKFSIKKTKSNKQFLSHNNKQRHSIGINIFNKIKLNNNIIYQNQPSLTKSKSKTSTKTPTISSSLTSNLQKKYVKQNFTFRNRTKKQRVIKKLDLFIDFLQNQQKQNLKSKSHTINQINFLQNKSNLFYNRYQSQSIYLNQHTNNNSYNIISLQSSK